MHDSLVKRLCAGAVATWMAVWAPGCGDKPAAPAPATDAATTAPKAAKPSSHQRAPALEVRRPKATAETADADLGTLPDGVGLAVGAKVADFTVKDADGKDFALAKHTAKGPILLVFYRGGW